MTEQKHWAADEAARSRLVEFGKTKGLDSDGILEILGIKKLSEHKGKEAEAIAAIAKWAKENEPPEDEPAYQMPPAYNPVELDPEVEERYAEAVMANMPSVPVWIRMDGRCNYDISVQAWLPPELARVGLVYARQAFEDYQNIFADVLVDNRNGAQKPVPALQLVPQSENGGTQTFSPQTLEYAGKSEKGSLYWKCKGHPFNQYGVTIWEESLPPELKEKAVTDLAQDLDLTGWVATYSLQPSKNDPEKMVPDKVVSLTKAA